MRVLLTVALFVTCCLLGQARLLALGPASAVELAIVEYAGRGAARPTAPARLAWALRQRTSVETALSSRQVRFDDPALFDTPLLYWSGDADFPPLTEAEIAGLRRFVELGGFVMIDDAAPERGEFDRSVRTTLERAFGADALQPIDNSHTIFRSFYLLSRPVGRILGPETLEAIERAGRAAVVYSRHDLGGAWARDNLGNYLHPTVPGGNTQREMAYRLGVNLVMYALCLDYKDDQVHSPFIMRRRAGMPLPP